MMCYQMKAKSKTEQLNLRPPKKIVERLRALAIEFRGEDFKRTEIAVDILIRYIDSWEEWTRRSEELFTAQKVALNSRSALPVADATQEGTRRRRAS